MKRILSIALAITLVFPLILILPACDNTGGDHALSRQAWLSLAGVPADPQQWAWPESQAGVATGPHSPTPCSSRLAFLPEIELQQKQSRSVQFEHTLKNKQPGF